MPEHTNLILVSGATGYVGSRLVPRLLEAGYKVRATSRSLEKLKSRNWAKHPNVELAELDVQNIDSVKKALTGCSCVYYLVHSMNPQTKDFKLADSLAAKNMVEVGEQTGIKRLIYLGGLGERNAELSKHLQSRAEVAEILQQAKFSVTVLRAAMIIGSGSASFEILRYLVDRLPVMITPRWVSTKSQPIAIRNVLNYLIACLVNDKTLNQTFDIGGPEILSYAELMNIYAEEAGLNKRAILPVPVFSPRLSSYWIHLVTPVPAYIARPLAEGLRNPALCHDNSIQEIIPQELFDCRKAIRLALDRTHERMIESHWTDAGRISPAEWSSTSDPSWSGGTIYEDRRVIVLNASANNVWKSIIELGGEKGWYYGNWLWILRGFLDKLFGGVGLHRGRRHPEELRPGDALDFWRVKQIEDHKLLSLFAEMKLPGEAILEFHLRAIDANTTELEQIARFLPKGLEGMLYWFAVSPLHELVFNGMLNGIAEASTAKILSGPKKINPGL